VVAVAVAAIPVASAFGAGSVTTQFTATSDWGSGHEVRVTVANGSDASVATWRVEFDLPAGTTISSFWDADVTRTNNHYVATKKSWAGAIPPGGSQTWGYIGTGAFRAPTNCTINGAPCGGGTTPTTVAPPTSNPPTTAPPTTAPPTTQPPTTGPPPPAGRKLVGYFAQWGVYQRQYFVKNIHTSGSASKLTHILYAFGNVTNGQCVIGDSYADYDMAYTTANSVDGVADTWDAGALRGSFGQLRKLKRMYPNIKVIWSFGGWTWSGGFGQAAQNPTAFANSCYNRQVLLAASVVGTSFWPGAVAAALSRPVEWVERCLRRLEQRDFVHERAVSTIAGQAEYRFRHVLVRDVCYRRLPRTELVARHERAAGWLDGLSSTRDTDLAEVLAHHRWAAHEIARRLGVRAERYAAAAREALHRAARRAYALHALDAAAAHAERALALPGTPGLELELLAAEISFHRAGSLDVASLTSLAERLFAGGDHAGAARAWTLLGQAAWVRADRPAALASLDRAVELFDALPDSAQKADAYAELGRLHMLNYEREPAVQAATAAAEMASRLGATEVAANARITIAAARYQAGERAGLDALHEVTTFCRERRLLALPRAVQNLAWAVREEGDWVGSDTLLGGGTDPGVLVTGYSGEAMRAYFAGDFPALLTAADAFLHTPTGRWDMQVRGVRSVLRILRGEPHTDDVDEALDTARGSGFHRPYWTALGLGALCRALAGRRREAAALLDELVSAWRPVPALASGEWVAAAANAAALTGPDAAALLREALGEVPHRTPWVEAALHTVSPGGAAGLLAAAEIYAGIPDATDRVLALALGAGELRRTGDHTAADTALQEVRAFAHRNQAPGLVRLAHGATPDTNYTPILAS
jgi:tetratricopeptide (TPR) repeat protein